MIACDNLNVCSGSFCLQGISFRIPAGKYGVLMGPSGCGKTTLLEALCGLRKIETGTVHLGDKEATYLGPAERGVGFVPQDGALFPRMTVQDNLAFALNVRHLARDLIDHRVEELADRLSIGHLLKRKATGLSGGEAQRVALGRALAARPSVLLLDEPLSALDETTRDQMVDLLSRVQHESGVTALHVTHSRREANQLADTLIEMSAGRVIEHSTEPQIERGRPDRHPIAASS